MRRIRSILSAVWNSLAAADRGDPTSCFDSGPENAEALRIVLELVLRDEATVANVEAALVRAFGDAPASTEEPFMDMVAISGGRFMMGSPPDEDWHRVDEEQRIVNVAAFQLGKYPVTQAQWRSVMDTSPSRFNGDRDPVEQVSWDDAVAFCDRLSDRKGLVGEDRYRLPTEAEWEYACRAGTTSSRYGNLDEVAWYYGNAGGSTHPVGEKLPNAFGLYDMLGNVWEWCSDGDDRKVVRGGSRCSGARDLRAATRDMFWSSIHSDRVGFRVARGPKR